MIFFATTGVILFEVSMLFFFDSHPEKRAKHPMKKVKKMYFIYGSVIRFFSKVSIIQFINYYFLITFINNGINANVTPMSVIGGKYPGHFSISSQEENPMTPV